MENLTEQLDGNLLKYARNRIRNAQLEKYYNNNNVQVKHCRISFHPCKSRKQLLSDEKIKTQPDHLSDSNVKFKRANSHLLKTTNLSNVNNLKCIYLFIFILNLAQNLNSINIFQLYFKGLRNYHYLVERFSLKVFFFR